MSDQVLDPLNSSTTKASLLIIGAVWPEPKSSAGGSRTMELIHFFQDLDYHITFASSAAQSEHAIELSKLNIDKAAIELNDASFDSFISDLNPQIVLFDKFMTEEQFGWRVKQNCPETLCILDTIDLHCLRKARHQAVKENRELQKEDLFSEIAKREVAAIYRSDLSLMISQKEVEILQEVFSVPQQQLHFLPFLLDTLSDETIQNWTSFEKRQHFMTIGNFLHDPNWDAVLYLKQDIWPRIRKRLPDAELHIFGSYVPQKALQLNNPKEGFLVLGRAESVHEVMSQSKVCLAPLRFGAGMKGKLIDAMVNGTPSVTTSIGAESMHDISGLNSELPWAGFVEDEVEAFVNAAVRTYTEKDIWLDCQNNGVEIINKCFDKREFVGGLEHTITSLLNNLSSHRLKNFTGQMLNHHSMKSTYYMSKWIEAKHSKSLTQKSKES